MVLLSWLLPSECPGRALGPDIGTATTWVGILGPPDWIGTPIQSRLIQSPPASSLTRGGVWRLDQAELPGAWPGARPLPVFPYAFPYARSPQPPTSAPVFRVETRAQRGWACVPATTQHTSQPALGPSLRGPSLLCAPLPPSREHSPKTGGGLHTLQCQDTGVPGVRVLMGRGTQGSDSADGGLPCPASLPWGPKGRLTSLPCLER